MSVSKKDRSDLEPPQNESLPPEQLNGDDEQTDHRETASNRSELMAREKTSNTFDHVPDEQSPTTSERIANKKISATCRHVFNEEIPATSESTFGTKASAINNSVQREETAATSKFIPENERLTESKHIPFEENSGISEPMHHNQDSATSKQLHDKEILVTSESIFDKETLTTFEPVTDEQIPITSELMTVDEQHAIIKKPPKIAAATQHDAECEKTAYMWETIGNSQPDDSQHEQTFLNLQVGNGDKRETQHDTDTDSDTDTDTTGQFSKLDSNHSEEDEKADGREPSPALLGTDGAGGETKQNYADDGQKESDEDGAADQSKPISAVSSTPENENLENTGEKLSSKPAIFGENSLRGKTSSEPQHDARGENSDETDAVEMSMTPGKEREHRMSNQATGISDEATQVTFESVPDEEIPATFNNMNEKKTLAKTLERFPGKEALAVSERNHAGEWQKDEDYEKNGNDDEAAHESEPTSPVTSSTSENESLENIGGNFFIAAFNGENLLDGQASSEPQQDAHNENNDETEAAEMNMTFGKELEHRMSNQATGISDEATQATFESMPDEEKPATFNNMNEKKTLAKTLERFPGKEALAVSERNHAGEWQKDEIYEKNGDDDEAAHESEPTSPVTSSTSENESLENIGGIFFIAAFNGENLLDGQASSEPQQDAHNENNDETEAAEMNMTFGKELEHRMSNQVSRELARRGMLTELLHEDDDKSDDEGFALWPSGIQYEITDLRQTVVRVTDVNTQLRDKLQTARHWACQDTARQIEQLEAVLKTAQSLRTKIDNVVCGISKTPGPENENAERPEC